MNELFAKDCQFAMATAQGKTPSAMVNPQAVFVLLCG